MNDVYIVALFNVHGSLQTQFASCFTGNPPTQDLMECGQWEIANEAQEVGLRLSQGNIPGATGNISFRVLRIERLG